jgi:hypothetical protein
MRNCSPLSMMAVNCSFTRGNYLQKATKETKKRVGLANAGAGLAGSVRKPPASPLRLFILLDFVSFCSRIRNSGTQEGSLSWFPGFLIRLLVAAVPRCGLARCTQRGYKRARNGCGQFGPYAENIKSIDEWVGQNTNRFAAKRHKRRRSLLFLRLLRLLAAIPFPVRCGLSCGLMSKHENR